MNHCCCAVAAIPYVSVKTVKDIAWISGFGTIIIVIAVVIILVMTCNQVDIHQDVVIWDTFQVALATIAFSFGGNIVYTHVEASLKEPKHWNKISITGLRT
jgi:hypothetical protein